MNSENIMTLHQMLKKQTMGLHEKGHHVPYIKNLLNNDIQIESFVGHLRALAIIYGTLEHQLSTLKQKEINGFLEGYAPKLPLILADLEYFNAKTIRDIIPAVSKALQIADKILFNRERNPYKLLGFLYTLDGSLNGGNILKKHVAETFNLESNNGVNYYSAFNKDFKQYWGNFTEHLNKNIIESQLKEDIVSAADEIFNDLIAIYECLYPVDEKLLGNHVTSLNPEAGYYPIPTNPIEIEAAISAGLRCWDEFPFYQKRYGERGRRFAVSDSAWLVTLYELSKEMVNEEVFRLADSLAIRGMPTITMEFQLKYLYEELSKQIPKNEPEYKNLLFASEQLKKQRIAWVPIAVFENSNAIFNDFCKQLNIRSETMKNTGLLIASSISDAKRGVLESLHNYKTWITNPDLFSENWIMAIEKTYLRIEEKSILK